MGLSYDEIAEILKIIDSSSCDEVIIETGDIKLVVRRNSASGATPIEFTERGAIQPIAVAPQAGAVQATGLRIQAAADQVAVMAPMVGTFYRAASPDVPPFVEVGSIVEAGQPVCLIEVMKLFTTINAEISGRIVEIGAEDGELVEYGRTLFVIEPV